MDDNLKNTDVEINETQQDQKIDDTSENVQTSEDVQTSAPVYTDEEIEARQQLLDLAMDLINSYNLTWTIRSIDYIVNREGVTFNQLRSCVFKNKAGDVYYDYNRATRLIIQAGLVGSKQITQTDTKALEEKAYDIVEDWRYKFGYVGTLHILLINIMEREHFFMGTQDLKVLELLSFRNLQTDLAKSQLALDMETKLNQSRALQ